MKTYLECLPRLMSQALKAARAATDDEGIHRKEISGTPADNKGLKACRFLNFGKV